MNNKMSSEEFRKTLKPRKNARQNKYNNVISTYDGVTYHSKLEADYARHLDFLKKAGEVSDWHRQVNLPLVVYRHKVTTYRIDFKVLYSDGTIVYVEVKGKRLPDWVIKWELLLALRGTIDDPTEKGSKLKIVTSKDDFLA